MQSQDNDVRFVRDPDLPEVEARFSHYRQQVFRKHTHEAYAISLVQQGITAHEFGRIVGVRTGDVVRQLMSMGEMVPGGGTIPFDAI